MEKNENKKERNTDRAIELIATEKICNKCMHVLCSIDTKKNKLQNIHEKYMCKNKRTLIVLYTLLLRKKS